jgi:hypothetical protein
MSDITAITAIWIMVSLFLAVMFNDDTRDPPRILVPSFITAGAALSLLDIVINIFRWMFAKLKAVYIWLFAYRN